MALEGNEKAWRPATNAPRSSIPKVSKRSSRADGGVRRRAPRNRSQQRDSSTVEGRQWPANRSQPSRAPPPNRTTRRAPPRSSSASRSSPCLLAALPALGRELGWWGLRPALELLATDAVDAALATHTLLHVGGPHRGGTTVLSDLLEAHPRVAGLATPSGALGSRSAVGGGSKGPLNEGLFLQSVLPKFRLSMDPGELILRLLTGTLRQNGTGWGSYAYAADAHLTERNETGLLTEQSRRTLMTEWARHWPALAPPRRVLLEKSPTNVMLWRLLDALWSLGGPDGRDVRFLFIRRHPLAVALAQRSYLDASHLSVRQLVEHWLYQQESLARDLDERPDAAARVRRLRYEDLAADPAGTLATIFEWLGVDDDAAAARASAVAVLRAVPFHAGKNQKKLAAFCKALARDGCGVLALEPRVAAAGYSLREWSDACGVQCA